MSRGLTLVEFIITILLTAIIGLSTGLLVSEHLKGGLNARDHAVAMNLARAEIERVESWNDFCAVSSSPFAPVSGYPAYELERAVTCQTPTTSCACSCTLVTKALDCTVAAANTNDVKRINIRVRKSVANNTVGSLISHRTRWVSFGQ